MFFGLVAGVGFEPADAAGDCSQSPRAERPSAGLCPAFLFYLCRVSFGAKKNALRLRVFYARLSIKKTRLVGGCFFGLVAGVGFEPTTFRL